MRILRDLLINAGWETTDVLTELSLAKRPIGGIDIQIRDSEPIPQGAEILAQFLRQQGIAVRVVKTTNGSQYNNSLFAVLIGSL